MPIIQFTPADALLTVKAEPGNYPVVIREFEGPKASTSQKSVSYFTHFVVTSGPMQGKEFTVVLNTGTKNHSLLNGMQYEPHALLLQIDAAINKTKVEPVNKNIDTDLLVNRPLVVSVGVETADGQIYNVITGFYPEGTSTAPVF